jgi:hypothetical protein
VVSQPGWRWYHKCQVLFFALNPTQGVCPCCGSVVLAAVKNAAPGTFNSIPPLAVWPGPAKLKGSKVGCNMCDSSIIRHPANVYWS